MTMGGGITVGTEADKEKRDKDQASDKHTEDKESDNS